MVPRPVIARIQIGTQVYASPAVYVKARMAAHADAWPVDLHANLTDLQCWPKRTPIRSIPLGAGDRPGPSVVVERHPVVCRDEETRVEIPRALATAVVAVPTRHEPALA